MKIYFKFIFMNANIENLFAGFSGIREVIEFVTDTRTRLFNSDLQEISDVAVEKLGLLEDGESLLEALNEMKSFIKQEQKRKSESAFTGDYSTSIRIEKIVIPRIRTLMESFKRYANGILSCSYDKPAFVSRNEIEQKYRRTDLDNILWSWRRRARFLVTDEEIKVAVAYVVERFEDSIAEEYSWMIRETIQSAINECYEMNMNTELKNIVIGRYLKLQEEIASSIKAKEPRYYSRREAAEILRVTLPTLHSMTKQGMITAKKVGRRILYDADAFDEAVKEDRVYKYKRRNQ